MIYWIVRPRNCPPCVSLRLEKWKHSRVRRKHRIPDALHPLGIAAFLDQLAQRLLGIFGQDGQMIAVGINAISSLAGNLVEYAGPAKGVYGFAGGGLGRFQKFLCAGKRDHRMFRQKIEQTNRGNGDGRMPQDRLSVLPQKSEQSLRGLDSVRCRFMHCLEKEGHPSYVNNPG
jgi:hypothetical protein